MRKLLLGTIAALFFLALAFFLGVPRLARVGGLRWGSEQYARKWKAQLLACQSLDEVRQHFNCFIIEWRADGDVTWVPVTETVKGRPRALLKSFPDGRWIACAHADSHSEPGGGTIVSRDSTGEIHVFFGPVCGNLSVQGETPEEFYRGLRSYNGVREVFLR